MQENLQERLITQLISVFWQSKHLWSCSVHIQFQ